MHVHYILGHLYDRYDTLYIDAGGSPSCQSGGNVRKCQKCRI